MSHVNKVIDADPHFVIDINTRNIKNVSQTKTSLVQYDHNSERFSFTLPRFIEGHDMMECNSVQVHYFSSANPDTKGLYEIDDLSICEEDTENVCCTWLISRNVTQTAGALQFILRFACLADDGTEEYAWHTNPFRGISISAGMNNAEAVAEQYADILEQWRIELFSLTEEGIRNINTEKEKAVASVESAGQRVLDSIPEDYTDLSANIANALKRAVSGEAVGITDVSPIGHTMGVKARSKNLIPYPYTDTTTVHSGITFTDNGDGSITCNGTATASAIFYFYRNETQGLQDGVYSLSGNPNNQGSLYIRAWNTGKMIGFNQDTGNGSANQVISGKFNEGVTIYYRITAGTTVENLVIRPQLELSPTITPYTPYVNVTTATVKKLGGNLLDINDVTERTAAGLTVTKTGDGGFNVVGASTTSSLAVTRNGISNISVLPPGTYTVVGYDKLEISMTDTEGKKSYRKGTFTINSPHYLNDVVVSGLKAGEEYNLTIYPALVVGDVGYYEPYKEPITHTINADGTVEDVTAIYPNTTLLPDTSGIVLAVEYNRDINKAFEELAQAIVSLGGNV